MAPENGKYSIIRTNGAVHIAISPTLSSSYYLSTNGTTWTKIDFPGWHEKLRRGGSLTTPTVFKGKVPSLTTPTVFKGKVPMLPPLNEVAIEIGHVYLSMATGRNYEWDGFSWTDTNPMYLCYPRHLLVHGDTFLCVSACPALSIDGGSKGGTVHTSTDGRNWVQLSADTSSLNFSSVAWNGTTLVGIHTTSGYSAPDYTAGTQGYSTTVYTNGKWQTYHSAFGEIVDNGNTVPIAPTSVAVDSSGNFIASSPSWKLVSNDGVSWRLSSTVYVIPSPTPTPPTPAPIPTHLPANTLISQVCSGTTLMGTYADGVGGTYIAPITVNCVDCGYGLYPIRGTLQAQYCVDTTLMGKFADGVGGTYTATIAENSTECGYTAPPVGHTSVLNLPYGTANLQYVSAYIPTNITIKGTVIRVHGGSWMSFEESVPKNAEVADFASLSENGYIVVDVNYRAKNDGGQFPNSTNDVVTALGHCLDLSIAAVAQDSRWVDLAARISAHPVMVTGTSAGGHLAVYGACQYGTQSGKFPDAVVSLAGPFELNYNNVFIDPLVQGAVINPYVTDPLQLDTASPRYMYGTAAQPGPWFTAVNSSQCKFYFIQNKNDTLVTDLMSLDAANNFAANIPTRTVIDRPDYGPPKGEFDGLTPIVNKGATPDGTLATLPLTGNTLGDAYVVDGLFWVYNNGTYGGDAINPASVNGFTRWFDHNYTLTEPTMILDYCGRVFA